MNIFINILTIVLAIALILILGCFLITEAFFLRRRDQICLEHFENAHLSDNPQYDILNEQVAEVIAWARETGYEELEIESFDKLKLRAVFIKADQGNKIAICIHGYRVFGLFDTGLKAKLLRKLGYNLLIVDDRAHGASEGKYIGFANLDRRDVLSWCEYLKNKYDNPEIILAGTSMGAATALAVAGSSELKDMGIEIKGVIADCGFSSGVEQVKHVARKQFYLPYFPFVWLVVMWLKILAKYDIREYEPKELIKNYKGHLLIIHGENDNFVPTRMGNEIYEAATCKKDIMIVPGAEHALSYIVDKEGYESKVTEFVQNLGVGK